MEVIYWLITAIILSGGFSLYAKKKLPQWKERHFGEYDFKWNKIFAWSSVVAFAVSTLVFLITSSLAAALAIIPLGYMLVLGSVVDFKISKIPADISFIAYLVPIPLLLLFSDRYGWFSFAVWMGLVAFFFIFTWIGMFGFADLRILILAGTSLSWWVGIENLAMAFGFSAIIQLIFHAIAHIKKSDIGTMKTRTGWLYEKELKEQKEAELLENTPNSEEVKANDESVNETEEVTLVEDVDNADQKKKAGKKKKFLPFGPALYISFTLLAIVYGFYLPVTV